MWLRRVILILVFSERAAWGGGGAARLFFPVQQTTTGISYRVNKVVFFGLATNALNVRNNNNMSFTFWIMLKILHHGPLCSRFNVVTSA